uniref:C-type lectin domain-containing protein n=1 Tax=Acrobeloides nanus TaxID=290746 RepID=A0A914DPV5_9BILA
MMTDRPYGAKRVSRGKWDNYGHDKRRGYDVDLKLGQTPFYEMSLVSAVAFNLFITVLMAVIGSITPDCPGGVTYTNGICYKSFNQSLTWYQAEANCVHSGGHLASISDVFVNTFLAGYADAEFSGSDYWIGATTNYLGGGNWSWSDYNPFSYNNFGAGLVYNVGYCVSVNLPSGKWSNVSCSVAKPYLCEYVPSTMTCSTQQTSILACPNEFTFYEPTKTCFKLLKPQNFTNAINQCKSLGGFLASIHSAKENQFFVDVFSIDPYSYDVNITLSDNRHVWIGFFDPTHTLNYTWVDGSQVDFKNWAPGEPDDGLGVEHCGTLMTDMSFQEKGWLAGQWDDRPCDKLLPAFCEISQF